MWPFKKKPKTAVTEPVNRVGSILLPEPSAAEWKERDVTLTWMRGAKQSYTVLVCGAVFVYPLNAPAPPQCQQPTITISGHQFNAPRFEVDHYMHAVWTQYFARAAAHSTVVTLRATCVGDTVAVTGWPLGAATIEMSPDAAKLFLVQLEDAAVLAALDPEARAAALRLGAKGGS